MKYINKAIAIALAAAMTISLLPTLSFAVEDVQLPQDTQVFTNDNPSFVEEETPPPEYTGEPDFSMVPPDAVLSSDETTGDEIIDDYTMPDITLSSSGGGGAPSITAPDFGPDGKPIKDENGRIISTYGYPLKGDPYNNMMVNEGKADGITVNPSYYLRDENFFGKWNMETLSWDIVGKFNYENIPGLANVEAAVKNNNDYEAAKLAIYNYYIVLERERNRKKDTTSAKKDQITADLLKKNFMYNANSGISPIDLMYVDGTQKYITSDITDTITKYLGTRQTISMFLVASEKDGMTASFDSKETGEKTSPFIKIKVNGSDMTIYPTDDMYISAGSNSTKSMGSLDPEHLMAQEDAIGTVNLVNDNTKRIYMKFDISGLKKGDTITGATLNMHGSNITADKEKELVLFYADETSWNENEYTYSKVLPQVIFSYDQDLTWPWSQPANAGYRYREELMRFNTWYDKLVKMYNATGDESYAYTALRQLTDYINVRGNSPVHIVTLDVALRMQTIPILTLQLIESDHMNPDAFTAFLKFMWVEADSAKNFIRNGNWGTSETQGLYTIAANLPEFTDSTRWVNRVKQRYDSLSSELIKDDLSCTELAIGYVDYSISTLIGAKDVADALNIKDYPYTQKTLDNILGLGQFEYYASMPGLRDNQVGDGYSHRGNFKSRLTYLANWFDDDHLKYAVSNNGDDGEKPDFTSIMFPNGLKAVMRTGWDEKAMYLFTDADGGFGNHAHPDDNSIVASAYGQYLLIDPLYGTYSESPEKTWLMSTRAHNTVLMNKQNQVYNSGSAKKGTLPRWETNNSYDFLTTDSPNTPDASSYKRSTLFIRNKFWLVNDYIVPKNSNSNEYIQSWHFLPEANISMDAETKAVSTGMNGVNMQVVPVGTDDLSRSEIVKGLYSEGQGSITNANYTEFEKKQFGNTVFNTILFPENKGEDFDIVASKIEIAGMTDTDASAYEFFLQDKNNPSNISRYQYYQLHDMSKKGVVTVGSISTDATMLFVELSNDGNIVYMVGQDVSVVLNNDLNKTIFKSDTKQKEVCIDWGREVCSIFGSPIASDTPKKDNYTLSANGNSIKSVYVNQNSVKHSQSGDVIVFDGTVTPPDPVPTPTPTQKPPTHGGGGGGGGGTVSTPKPTNEPTPTSDPSPTPTGDPTPIPSSEPTPSIDPTEKPVMNSEMKKEVTGHWAEKEICELYEKNIIAGQSENSLGLADSITRAEFITLLVRTLDTDISPYQNEFTDVAPDEWYADYIQTAYEKGWINGYEGTVSPTAPITREEMAKILAGAVDKPDIDGGMTAFVDTDAMSDWSIDSIKKVNGLGLMSGLPDGTFAPKANTKRDEAFVVIYRLLHL